MAMPLNWFSMDTLEMQVSPMRMRAKVSSGPNCRAKRAICGAASARTMQENTPPKMEAASAQPMALPALPARAMGKPSNAVAADWGVPGVLMSTAEMEPPQMEPQ